MKLINKNTGEMLLIKNDPIERQRRRVARMRVAVWAAISCIARNDPPQACTPVMLTLTYAEVGGWGARDIRQAVRWARGVGCKGYVWVAELQKRGAVHYHLLVQWPSKRPWIKPNESNGAWGKGFTWVTPDVKNPWYLLKYIQKELAMKKEACIPKDCVFTVSVSTLCVEWTLRSDWLTVDCSYQRGTGKGRKILLLFLAVIGLAVELTIAGPSNLARSLSTIYTMLTR